MDLIQKLSEANILDLWLNLQKYYTTESNGPDFGAQSRCFMGYALLCYTFLYSDR